MEREEVMGLLGKEKKEWGHPLKGLNNAWMERKNTSREFE
jgi:hypothetical protein